MTAHEVAPGVVSDRFAVRPEILSELISHEYATAGLPPPDMYRPLAQQMPSPTLLGRVRARLASEAGLHVDPETLLHACPAGLAATSATADRLGRPSLLQEFRLHMDPPTVAGSDGPNVMRFGYEIEGPLDIEAVEQAVRDLIRRQEALTSTFGLSEGGTLRVLRCGANRLGQAFSLCTTPMTDLAASAGELARPMSMRQGPLFRVLAHAQAPGRWLLAFGFEHIVFDRLSAEIWVREFATAYAALVAGELPKLPRLPCSYYDLAAWQRLVVASRSEHLLRSWRDHVGDAGPYPQLGLPRREHSGGTDMVVTEQVSLPASVRSRLVERLAEGRPMSTAFMVWFAALARALARLTDRHDVALAAATAGRSIEESHQLIGFFSNLAILRIEVPEGEPFAGTLTRTRRAVLAALSRDELPFTEVLRVLYPNDYGRVPPVPYCTLDVITADRALTLPLPGLRVRRADLSAARPRKRHHGLDVVVMDSGTGWQVLGRYREDTYHSAQIRGVLAATVRELTAWLE